MTVEFVLVGDQSDQPLTVDDVACMTSAAEGIRKAAYIVDAPCSEMHTNIFLKVRLNRS